jgi:hypothetical protein
MLTTSSRIPAWTADWPSYCSLLRRPTVDTAESSAVGSGRCPMARSPREVHEGASRVDGRWMELAMPVACLSSQWVRHRFRLSGPCAVSSRREGNTPRFFCLQVWELSGSYRRPVRGCTWDRRVGASACVHMVYSPPGMSIIQHRLRRSQAKWRCREERSVKPSAQPTLVRTQHLPPPAKTARSLRKRGPAGRFLLVPVGAENLRHLGRCFAGRRRLGHANDAWRAGLVRAGVR